MTGIVAGYFGLALAANIKKRTQPLRDFLAGKTEMADEPDTAKREALPAPNHDLVLEKHLRARNEELQRRVDSDREARRELEAEVRGIRQQLSQLIADNAEIAGLNAALSNERARLKARVAELEGKLHEITSGYSSVALEEPAERQGDQGDTAPPPALKVREEYAPSAAPTVPPSGMRHLVEGEPTPRPSALPPIPGGSKKRKKP